MASRRTASSSILDLCTRICSLDTLLRLRYVRSVQYRKWGRSTVAVVAVVDVAVAVAMWGRSCGAAAVPAVLVVVFVFVVVVATQGHG